MQIVPEYLPQEFGALLLSLALILTLAPYLSGHDFGIFKIPDFGVSARNNLKWIGPALLVTGIIIHIPFGPALCDEPIYKVVTDKELCGTTTEEFIVNPAKPKTCRHPDFGHEGWSKTETVTQSSGWRGGGSNQANWCNQLTASFIQSRTVESKYDKEILGSREESNKDWKGHVTYNYHCTVKVSWEPVYSERTDPKCGMTPAERGLHKVAAQCKQKVGTKKVECGA